MTMSGCSSSSSNNKNNQTNMANESWHVLPPSPPSLMQRKQKWKNTKLQFSSLERCYLSINIRCHRFAALWEFVFFFFFAQNFGPKFTINSGLLVWQQQQKQQQRQQWNSICYVNILFISISGEFSHQSCIKFHGKANGKHVHDKTTYNMFVLNKYSQLGNPWIISSWWCWEKNRNQPIYLRYSLWLKSANGSGENGE